MANEKEKPVFGPGVTHVRVTPGGVHETFDFKGKTFEKGSEIVKVSDLGWNESDLQKADADPSLVIERFNAKGQMVKASGKPLKTLAKQPASRANRDDVADTAPVKE